MIDSRREMGLLSNAMFEYKLSVILEAVRLNFQLNVNMIDHHGQEQK